MSPTAVVVGSLNMDLVIRVPRVPGPGETLAGHGFAQAEGGKGANQAVAAARLGARVAMIGRVGADGFGAALRAALARDGIDTTHVSTDAGAPSGVAMILVEDGGENRIVLAPGANTAMAPAQIDAAWPLIAACRVLAVQLEIPMASVRHAVARGRRAGALVLLNPAPAVDGLPDDIWAGIDLLVPNETEAARLAGVDVCDPASAAAAARVLRARGVGQVIITLGAQGLLLADAAGEMHLPARPVAAVDTTAAGDSLIGGVIAGLCDGMSLLDAARFGLQAASITVARPGAQPSLPYKADLSAIETSG
jgi:ribokinase